MDLTIDMLLSKRDYDTLAFTRKIIDLFGERLTKAVQMHYKFDRSIFWHTVERFRAIPGYVMVRGNAEIRPGDIMTLPEGEVLVTEDNVERFSHTLSYMLDSKVLQHGTTEDVFQHLSYVDEMAKKLSEGELITALRAGPTNQNAALSNPVLEPILEKITRPTVFESFDTSDLSEEQYKTLRLCATIGKTRQQ